MRLKKASPYHDNKTDYYYKYNLGYANTYTFKTKISVLVVKLQMDQIAELDLGSVVDDKLVVEERAVGDVCVDHLSTRHHYAVIPTKMDRNKC